MKFKLIILTFLFSFLFQHGFATFAFEKNPQTGFKILFPFKVKQKSMAPSEDNNDHPSTGKSENKKKVVYKFDLKTEIGPPTWRQTQAAFKQAEACDADYILIHMNTYGGAVDAADNICTKILESKKPVFVYVDKNAASAGALISIACDSIYMAPGSSIGAATVVDQSGTPLPEKYQSYMRSKLRATAEANGRDPKIAEGMNDPRIYIAGVNDSGKVITFTTHEAIKNKYCQGEATSIKEVLNIAGIKDYSMVEYEVTTIESIIDFLLSPAVSGILIMIIIGGIYFELQSPGIGFPIFAAIGAAILYFAPLYLEGLAANWEILIFVLGVILVIVELFVIPGFGVIGISGIVLIVLGLSLSLVGSLPSTDPIDLPSADTYGKALFTVVVSLIISLAASIYLASKMFESRMFGKFVLSTTQNSSAGYVSSGTSYSSFVGKKGIANTVLRPTGKVEIENDIYDAFSEAGFIEKGEKIEVVRYESAQLYVKKSNA